MNTYLELKQELEDAKCTVCYGAGKVNDAEPGDMSYSEAVCPTCKGTGFGNKGPRLLRFIQFIHDATVSKSDANSKLHTIHELCDEQLGHKQ